MKTKSVFGRLLSFALNYKWLLLLSILFGLIYVASTIVVPILTGYALDLMIGKNDVNFKAITNYVIIILVIFILGAFFQYLMTYITSKVSFMIVKDLREASMNKLLKVKVSYIDHTKHGEIVTKVINDIDNISDGLIQGFQHFFTGLLTIIATLTFMFILCYPLAICVLILTPLSMVVSSFIAKGSSSTFKKQADLKGELGSTSNEYLSSFQTVSLFSYEEEACEKFTNINQELAKVGFKAQFFAALVNPSTRFVNALIYALLATLGALVVYKGNEYGLTLTVGTLVSFLTYASNYTKPFNEISNVIAELTNSLSSCKRVFELLDEEVISDDSMYEDLKNVKGSLAIKNVFFSYYKNQKLIEDLSLEIKPGMKVAIVGPTGCGKTTLINLLMRFYEPNQGKILIENHDINKVTRKSLRDAFGMVLQETWLFKGTVKENIAYSKLDATDEEIIMAAKKAHAHNFIKRLPKGYNTIISDDEGLSQGQKQLLCIARLMLKMPPMLILDEATSSIDTRTELIIQEAFTEMMKGRTSFVIAHRLSTIVDADTIIVMKDGNVIEIGNHDDLLKRKGFYYSLYESQFKIV